MKMNPALGTPHPGNVLPKLDNTNTALGDIQTMNDVSSHRTNATFDKQRGRARGRVAMKDKHTSGVMSPGGEHSGGEEVSSADEGGPSKKRRRSRKGQDRKYECSEKGCGKAYSRAEHLYRHQLNHRPKVIFHCDYEGCERNFVRLDLCNRHKERHEAKDRLAIKSIQNSNPSPSTNATNPKVPLPQGSLSPETIKTEDSRTSQLPYFNLKREHVSSPFSPTNTISSAGDASGTPTSGWFAPEVIKHEDSRPPQLRHFNSQHENISSTFSSTATMSPAVDASNTPTPGWLPRSNSDHNVPQATEPSSRFVYPMQDHSGVKTNFHNRERYASLNSVPPTSEGIFLHSPGRPTDGRYGLEGMQSLSQASPFLSSSDFSPSAARLHHNVQRRTTESDVAQQNYNSAHFMLPTRHISQPHSISASYSVPQAGQSVPVGFHDHSASNEFFNPDYIDNIPSQYMPFFLADGADGYERSPTGWNDNLLKYMFEDQVDPLSLNNSAQQPAGSYSEVPKQFQHHYDPSFGFPPGTIAVNTLLQQTLPERPISDEKARNLFTTISAKFNESEETPIAPLKKQLLSGDREQEEHMLSTKNMQMYIECYFEQFHPQIPILHKPTFTADKTPNLLLIAIMAIGASCLDHNYEMSQPPALLSNFLAWHLRWEVFQHREFRPPGKLWLFQTLLLLELYEKMYSNRILHERAHLHHATTITLMRRGRMLISADRSADSVPQSPSNRDDTDHLRRSPVAGDIWWNNFIEIESTHRAAYAAFLIDSTHTVMFGHSSNMVINELALPLPCDENVWEAPTRDECWRLHNQIKTNRPISGSFLSGIKDLIHNKPVQTDTFGRTVLMAGLLNFFWDMTQKDRQLESLSLVGLPSNAKLKSMLRQAFYHWSNQYDEFLLHSYRKPYPRHEELVSESRNVLHHLARMVMYVSIVECQIYAGADRVLGRMILKGEFEKLEKKWKGRYHKTPEMRDAVYSALSFLTSVLMPNLKMKQSKAYSNEDQRYKARDDPLLNRPWVLYFAVLLVWCYGVAKEGPTKEQAPSKEWPGQQIKSMREYLLKFYKPEAKNSDYLSEMQGFNNNSGLLMVVSSSFENCRWELLNEAQRLLAKCIGANSGIARRPS